ncbi:MAG TPA: hypothetical protein VGZ71_08515 [Puia sp.]|nr:hypothetical protein [Puia sp.]
MTQANPGLKTPFIGVSPKKVKFRKKSPEGLAGAAPSSAHPNFTYHGGLVVVNPQVYTIFLGDWVSTQNQDRANRLNQFIIDLMKSTYMNILSQYGSGSTGSFIQSVFIANSNLTLKDAGIRAILQDAINNNRIPEPKNPSNVNIIFLDNATGIKDTDIIICEPANDNAFGYHNFFTTSAGNSCYYAVVPGLIDDCLRKSCGSDSTCSLQLGHSQEQRQTQVTSHEFSEMISDPQLNAWFDPNDGENGDICNGQTGTISVGANAWLVQLMYSKTDDDKSNGKITCISSVVNPYPSLIP